MQPHGLAGIAHGQSWNWFAKDLLFAESLLTEKLAGMQMDADADLVPERASESAFVATMHRLGAVATFRTASRGRVGGKSEHDGSSYWATVSMWRHS